MSRIEPDHYLEHDHGQRDRCWCEDDDPGGTGEPWIAAYHRETILAAIDDLRGKWNPELSDDPDEEAYLSGGDQALTNLRARFQPNEGENGHE